MTFLNPDSSNRLSPPFTTISRAREHGPWKCCCVCSTGNPGSRRLKSCVRSSSSARAPRRRLRCDAEEASGRPPTFLATVADKDLPTHCCLGKTFPGRFPRRIQACKLGDLSLIIPTGNKRRQHLHH